MGCCFSKQIDDTPGDEGATERKPATSPETNLSTASNVPTGPDIMKLESSGGAEIVTTQPTATPRPTRQTHKTRPQTYVGNHLDCSGQLMERTKPMFQGSFSDVSQAKLRGRVVAVKAFRVTDIEGTESQIWKRLAAEIYAWAALDHTNVLQVLGFAIEDGIPCLITPWCDNGTLQVYLQKFPNANRRQLVREVAEGLKYLHMQKPPIVHGDLKSTNVYVAGDHVAKISDFGTSRLVEQLRTGLTTSGSVSTTTRYSAPEILRDGQHSTLSSDVFSFAYVALETMSGKWPFWKIPNSASILRAVLEKQTPSPDDHPGVDDALWVLLRRCWNYEPSDRPHMFDVCKTLSATGYGSSTPAGPSYLSTRVERRPRGSTTV